ncbi:MAG: translocation/assembly module TamB domain-containing protein, partial [Exilibacterium sp.]
PARNPTISLFSQPEMAQQAKLHYLLTGQPPGVTVSQDSNYLAAQAALSLGLNTSDTVIDKTARALGIDNFRVTTESGDAGPTMQLSGYLSPKVLVRYGFGVFDAANSLTLRYKVGRNLYIEAASGQFNSLDILWFFEPREASAE